MACPWSGAKCGCAETFVIDPHKQFCWQVDQHGKMPERCASFLTPALADLHKRELPPTKIDRDLAMAVAIVKEARQALDDEGKP